MVNEKSEGHINIIERSEEKEVSGGKFSSINTLLESIIENTDDAICIIDGDFNILKINNRLIHILGVKKETLLNKKCYESNLNFICDSTECPMKKIKTDKCYFNYEIQKKLQGGATYFKETYSKKKYFPKVNKYINYYSNYIFDDSGNLILIVKILTDITENVRYKQELKENKKFNMFQAQFLANMSHEIRTPMNGIVGLVELLKDTELNNIQREYINMLEFSTDRLLSIVNDILDISKIQSGKLEITNSKFSILKLLEDIKDYFKLQANKKGLNFYYKKSNIIPNYVIGDLDKLNQVLFNIIGNAIKFTKKGYIKLETKVFYEDSDYIGIKFTIKDTGIGIPEEEIKFVFEIYNQLRSTNSRRYNGTGLGLTISKKLVELMGGKIYLNSKQGHGSIFSFKLKFL